MNKKKVTKIKNSPTKQIPNISLLQTVIETTKKVITKPDLSKLFPWAHNIASHPHLYRHYQEDNKTYHFFRIIFESLRDIEVASMKKNNYIQFVCNLYDVERQTFVGRTFSSEMFEVEIRGNQRPFLHCDKSIYVYTAMQKVVMKVQVWQLQAQRNRLGNDCLAQSYFLGHFQVDLTLSNQTGRVNVKLDQNQQTKFEHVETVEEIQHNKSEIRHHRQRPSTSIVFQVLNTHSLSYLQYFIPSEVICDENDKILGLKNGCIPEEGQIVADQRSKMRFQIQQIIIPRTILKYLGSQAQDIIQLTHKITGLPSHTVKDILFHIQFHNGWKGVSKQVLILKQKGHEDMTVSKQVIQNKSTMKKTVQFKDAMTNPFVTYSFDKMKELNTVFTQQGGTIIVWLEIKIEVKFDVGDRKNKQQKHEVLYLPIGFSLINIDNKQEQKIQKFELMQGNPYDLTNISQYLTSLKETKKPLKQDKNKLLCELMFYLIKSKGGIQSIGKDNMERDTQQVQSLKAQKQRLTRLHRKLRQDKRKKLIQINQEIPFLDPSKLKQELYQQKISKIKSEKQQKQDILQFLKAKVNQMEREALTNNYNMQNGESMDGSTVKLIHKMPQMFIDYKYDQNTVQKMEGITLNTFPANYCKKAQKIASVSQRSVVSDFIGTQTYLNIRVISFTPLRKQIDSFNLLVNDFDGNLLRSTSLTAAYKREDYKSLDIPINKTEYDIVYNMFTVLLNGFLPMYLQCDHFDQMIGLALVDVGELISQLQLDGIHASQIQTKVTFKQEQTQIAEAQFAFSFSQSHTQVKINDIQQNTSHIAQIAIKHSQFNMLDRINKYKQQKGVIQINHQKEQVLKKAISSLHSQKVKVQCMRNKKQIVRLNIDKSKQARRLCIKIFDEDEKCLVKPQIGLVYQSAGLKFQGDATMVDFKSKNVVELKPLRNQILVLEYLSRRKIVHSNLPFQKVQSRGQDKNRTYNREHKITVTLMQPQSNVVYQIFQLQICPTTEPGALQLQAFVYGKRDLILPFPCTGLTVQNSEHNFKLLPTKAVLTVPQLQIGQLALFQFTLAKAVPNLRESVPFQHIQLYVWGSVEQYFEGRLWDEQDLLLKVPIQPIIKRQIEQNSRIQRLKVLSKHIDLKIRSGQMFSYQSLLAFSRKNNQIFIRSKITCSSLGEQTYPVEVQDQHGNVMHRIAVSTVISFPTLANHQIINIKIPKDNLDQMENFAYQNLTGENSVFTTRALRPNLLKIVDEKFQVRNKDTYNLTLHFNWSRIQEELQVEQKTECQLLIGVTNGTIIDYFLFRCRNK